MNDLKVLTNYSEIHILNSIDDIYPFIWTTSAKPDGYSGLSIELIIDDVVDKIVNLIDKPVDSIRTPTETIQSAKLINEIRDILNIALSDYSDVIDESQMFAEINSFLPIDKGIEIVKIKSFAKKWVFKALINKAKDHISEEDLLQVLLLTGFPVSIVFERYYSDKVHRDSYYNYYSRMFRNVDRNCHRLSFFKGKYNYSAFYNIDTCDPNIDSDLQRDFMGVLVLTPSFDLNNQTSVGRVYLDPNKISIPHCYVRTTKFKFCILGRKFELEAYPFIRQNLVSMSCSESVLWNILEYFGNRYSDYRRVLPSDIIQCLDEYNDERLIPSSGLDIYSIQTALKKFGFEPKLYAKDQYHEKLKKFFHRYIESAVVVAMELNTPKESEQNPDLDSVEHSVVCIGHTDQKVKLDLSSDDAIFIDKLSDGSSQNQFFVIDSSHFYNEYVIIDDNQMPYVINTYGHFSVNRNMELIGFTAPIYKHVNLDAVDVELVVKTFLSVAGGAELIADLFKANNISSNSKINPLVLRYFLTTSRNFKKQRFSKSRSLNEKIFYGNIIYPKMIWVCELIDYSSYIDNKKSERCVLGEIVIDSTAVHSELINSIISLRVCNFISFRMPDDTYDSIRKDLTDSKCLKQYDNYGFTFPYEMYSNNNLKSNK